MRQDRILLAHGSGGQPEHVEAADQVDADDPLEIGERHRPFAADDPGTGCDAGAVDQYVYRAERIGDFFHCALTIGKIRHIDRRLIARIKLPIIRVDGRARPQVVAVQILGSIPLEPGPGDG